MVCTQNPQTTQKSKTMNKRTSSITLSPLTNKGPQLLLKIPQYPLTVAMTVT